MERHSAIHELKTRASLRHKRLQTAGDTSLPRLRDCLTAIAKEIGFPNWPTAKLVIEGNSSSGEFGTLLYPRGAGAHLNHWFTNHAEAADLRAQLGTYLLAYKRHFFVADRYFIQGIGLDPDDPDWAAIGFDWAQPADVAARARLYARLITRLPREAPHA